MSEIPDPRTQTFVEERPWGTFEQFTLNAATTVKIITVEPGRRLSLQTHVCRGELWRVLDGELDVTVGDETRVARSGDAVWVPVGVAHRLGNSGDTAGRVLEIAFGHFDETDIERLEDDYLR